MAKKYLLETIQLDPHELRYLWLPRDGGWYPAKVYHSGGENSGWLNTDPVFRKKYFAWNPKTYWTSDDRFGSYPRQWEYVSKAEVFAMLL